MYTEWRDVYFNPEVALSPSRFKIMEKLGFNHNNVHCVKGKKDVDDVYTIDLKSIMDLDQDWANYGDKFIRDKARAEKPWFLYYCTRGCHFDNYPNHKYAGKSPARTVFSDGMVEVDDIFGRLVKALEETGQLDNTIIILTLRQRPGDGNPAAWPQPLARRQRLLLGRGRARAHVRLLEEHDSAARFGWPVRPDRYPADVRRHGRTPGAELTQVLPQRTVHGRDRSNLLLLGHGGRVV